VRVERCEHAAELADATASLLASLLDDALATRGAAHLALAGGTTPAGAYAQLRPSRWDGVELWFGDERAVRPDDPQSNFAMVERSLLGHAAGALVHRIEGERGAEEAAERYDALLRERLGERVVLDIVLLGIGEDGHTASLFPASAALAERERAAVAVHGAPKPPPDRVSLTLPVLRAARACILLASGEGKAAALARVLAGPDEAVPASLLERERLTILADGAALGDGA